MAIAPRPPTAEGPVTTCKHPKSEGVSSLSGKKGGADGRTKPLHVRDDEETLQPRLAGRAPEVDDALAEMRQEHAAHEAVLRRLLAIVLAIAEEPSRPETLAEQLRPIAEEL